MPERIELRRASGKGLMVAIKLYRRDSDEHELRGTGMRDPRLGFLIKRRRLTHSERGVFLCVFGIWRFDSN